MRRTGVVMLLLALLPLTARADGRKPEDMVSDIRKELMGLPYYGVFDFLVFSSDGPTVTLGGYAYNGSLKTDAEREAKKVAGVENVVNNIEILPASINDDQIRWAAYRAIYRDAALSRYAPGGGWVPHGRMWRFDRPFGGFDSGRFSGQEPLGNHPIHIIVQNGRVTLLGVVDSQMDRTLAEMKVRQLPGTFAVTNELQVET
jgi:hypothetical protein